VENYLAALEHAFQDFATELDEQGKPERNSTRWTSVATVLKAVEQQRKRIGNSADRAGYEIRLVTYRTQFGTLLQLPESFDREYFGNAESQRHDIALDPRALLVVYRFAQNRSTDVATVGDEPPMDPESFPGELDLGTHGLVEYLQESPEHQRMIEAAASSKGGKKKKSPKPSPTRRPRGR
jgi:hypothetical protein